jgi:tRNA(fMet)-specific endonuclease VapC
LTGRLLDTDILINLVQGERSVTDRFLAAVADGQELYVSSISLFEFRYGMERASRHAAQEPALQRLLMAIEPSSFEPEDGERAARARAALAAKGAMIGPYDILIAGQAIARGWTLVTGNLREFSRVDGLVVEDWR